MAEPLTAAELKAAFERLTSELKMLAKTHPIALLGIANGGIPLVRMLARALGPDTQYGVLNALFHRDDVGLKAIQADFQATNFDFPIDDAHLVLVDDVFASGRTLRAALNELFDHGRPATVRVAVLVDVDQAILPLKPDFVGVHCACAPDQLIKVVLDENNPSGHTSVLTSNP